MGEWLLERVSEGRARTTLRPRNDKPILRAHMAALARRIYGSDERSSAWRGSLVVDLFQAKRQHRKL